MVSAEIIKLLTPRAQDLEMGNDHTKPSTDTITWENIAGHLGKLPSHIADYARAKYAETDEMQHTLASRVYANFLYDLLFVSKIALTENWPAGDADKLCQIVVREDVLGHRCRRCWGTGQINQGDRVTACQKCGGEGQLRYTGEAVARHLGITKRHFYRGMGHRYNTVKSRLEDWDRAIWSVVHEM